MTTTPWPDGPVLETGRLRLRRHQESDLDVRLAMVGDPERTRFVGGPQTPEENWNRLLRYAGHWALLGHGIFVVEDRKSGRFAGEVGLCDFRRGLGPDFDGAPEAAWMIADWAEGKGYAAEAVGAVIAWHESRFGARRQVCIIDPGNHASLRVAEKLGFTRMRQASYKDHDVIMHERRGGSPQTR